MVDKRRELNSLSTKVKSDEAPNVPVDSNTNLAPVSSSFLFEKDATKGEFCFYPLNFFKNACLVVNVALNTTSIIV